MKIRYVIVSVLFLTVGVFFIVNKFRTKNLEEMSPKEVVNAYYKARDDGNVELLQQIIYFSAGTTEGQKQKRIDSCNLTRSPEAKAIFSVMGMKNFAKYEKIIDEDSAEVGVCFKGGILQSLLAGKPSHIWKSYPADQIILKKDQGLWKYHHNKDNFTNTSELVEAIKKSPEDASLYYYYGIHTMSVNPYRAYKYFKKYYELEPDGFWVTEDFLERLKDFEDINSFEKMMLNCDAPPGNKSGVYTKIGLGFAECKDYEKANQYYKKAEEVLLKYPGPLAEERLEKAKAELQLRKAGKYHDILTELEQNQKE